MFQLEADDVTVSFTIQQKILMGEQESDISPLYPTYQNLYLADQGYLEWSAEPTPQRKRKPAAKTQFARGR
jgi:hypothetical protein